LLTFIAQKAGGTVTAVEVISIPLRFANAAISYVRYMMKMLWPDPLSPYYFHELNQINVMVQSALLFFLLQ